MPASRLSSPLRFNEIYVEKIWGGRSLEDVFRKQLPPGKQIGESWEISAYRDRVSKVREGGLAGAPIDLLYRDYPGDLVGSSVGDSFPILVKFIDACDTLSVQVHPDDDYASRVPGADPKTEFWYVCRATGDARIYKGLLPGVQKKDLAEALEEDRVSELLYSFNPSVGDVVYVSPGTIHALGAGVVVLEVQQSSDTTYRLYDWGRTGNDGKPRELHIEHSLAAARFDGVARGPEAVGEIQEGENWERRQVLSCPLFNAYAWELSGDKKIRDDGGRMTVLSVLSGSGKIEGEYGETLDVRPGDNVLLPASMRDCWLGGDPEIVVVETQYSEV